METLFGLPAHPLVVHAAVVLVPLAAVGIAVTAFWPAARSRLAWAVVVVAALGAVATFLAGESGGELEERVRETELVEEHAELGESGNVAAAAVLLGALGVAGVDAYTRRRRRRAEADGEEPASTAGLTVAVGVVAVLLAVGGTVQIARIGHSGAEATWSDTTEVERDD